MKIHLFFILCVVKTSFSRSSKKNEAKLEGNVMIERILNADRFDELADKIANMALEKLKHETTKVSDSVKTNTLLEPTSVKNVAKQGKKAHKSKVSKIDVNAVLQKKSIPFNELIFRYERFTKNPDSSSKKIHSKIDDNNKKKRQKTSKENADKNGTKEKLHPDSNEQSDRDLSKSQENSDSKKNKQTDLSSENMTFNTKLQNESGELKFGNEKLIIWGNNDKKSDETIDLEKSIEDQSVRQKKGLKPTTDIHVRAYSEQETNEDNNTQQKDDENQTDEAKIKGHSKHGKNQTASTNLPHNTEVDKTSIKFEPVPIHYDKEKDVNDENEILSRAGDKELMEHDGEESSIKLPFDMSDSKSDDETDTLTITEAQPKKRKRIVRKEGDTWFALEESPDYAEYHEKLKQMRKSLVKDHKR